MPVEKYIDSVEALSWLEQSDGKEHTVGADDTCVSARDALELVQVLYAVDTLEVLAQVVAVEYEFEEASGLTMVLPQDRGKRAALFAIEARTMREMGSRLVAEGERG